MTIQLASLASAGNSPEDTEAVESYLAKKRSASQRSIQQGIWRMEEKARRAEKRDFDCPRGFAKQRQSLGLLFCFLLSVLHVVDSNSTSQIITSMGSLAQGFFFLLEAFLM